MDILKFCMQLVAAAALAWGFPAGAADAPKGNVVSVTWLKDNIQRDDVVVLDASLPQLHAAQHIPGAVGASLLNFGPREFPPAAMEQRFQAWGISPGKKVVIYDQADPQWSARLFFDLYYHGYPASDLYILDGGLTKWKEAGGAVTKEPTPAPAKGTFRVTRLNEDVRVRLPEFLTASGDKRNNALVEALDAAWHFGDNAFFEKAGHVPGGILLPAADFYNADKTLKSPEEIQRMLDYLGIRREQQILTYCGGGVAAAVPYFALKHVLGYPNVKLFKESQLGWLQDERELPYWTYDAPYLMRESKWLKSWGGRMLRMYGVSQVSIIDVRAPDDFKMGHVPFAANIPAEVFRQHLNQPEKLAAILGPAGVNAADEAVVISGKGLTKDAALAYLALERLGQVKVSIFTDSLEKSQQAGIPVASEASADPKKAAADALKPTTYPVNLRKGTLIADPASTKGVYPKIFVASGKEKPAKAPAGTVVHVPYTDLINADGTPKAAKDIWTVLVKAGVPRYAELVSFSEDPGEAAANYYILKLMGFPDVKVLAM